MDVLMLSRIQFAAATIFHFFFVPLTLGLSILVAIMESIYVRSGNEDYKRLAQFFGKLFLINFATGIITGLTLEFQFGTNWAKYSKYVGDIFGSLLAIEATATFFLESTFIAVWVFGWKKLSPKAHALSIWLVAIASSMSAMWIIIANSWMQHPVGYVIRNGRAELADFVAIVTQKFAVLQFLHVVLACYVVGGFFVMGVSAYHILKKKHAELFRKSFRIASAFTLLTTAGLIAEGHLHGEEVAKLQPAKLAAMEALWETTSSAPMYLLQAPDEKNESNIIEALEIPGLLSFLSTGSFSGKVQGLKDFPKDERPPVTIVFIAFRLMAGMGFLFLLLGLISWILQSRAEPNPLLLKIIMYSIPLPYLACQFGWIVTEIGRQPWIVYGIMKTSDGVSTLAASQVAISLAAFVIVYTLLGAATFFVMYQTAVAGPQPNPSAGKESHNA